MSFELALQPSRHLRVLGADNEGLDKWSSRVVTSFAASQEAGLLVLAAGKPEAPLSASVIFWRDYASRYLGELCRTPEGADLEPIDAPSVSDRSAAVAGAPPMQGGEYLDEEVLAETWHRLDRFVRADVASSGDGLAKWLARKAPLWQAVGRVCFHLAENSLDPELPFAFLATYAPRLSRSGQVQYKPLAKALEEYAGSRNKKALVKLLSPVHRASQKSGFIKQLIDSGDLFQPLAWTSSEAYRFLRDVPLLEESGLLVRLPDWWRQRSRPSVSVTVGERRPSRLSADAMLSFDITLALGEERMSEREVRELLEADGGLVRFKGRWIEVDREKLSQALDHWRRLEAATGQDGLSLIEGMRLLAGAPIDLRADEVFEETKADWSRVRAGKWLGEMLSSLRDPESLATVKPGKALHGTLRPYQKTGLEWLWLLTSLRLGACLADDMGLGKTLQVLALLLTLGKERKAARKPSLLVLPASLLSNWKAEIERFAPSLKARFVHLSESDKSELAAMEADPRGVLAKTDLVLTTYGMVLRKKWLQQVAWRLVILDEAQAIKNPTARQTRAVKKLESEARIALTGTPVENRLGDLWSLFDFLCPGLLGTASRFKQFVKQLEKRKQDRYAPLRNLVSPYILRRLKTDKRVISDLPDKTEMKVFCGLARSQAGLYQRSVRDLAKALEGQDRARRRGIVLAYLMRFKQICNHPSHFLGDGAYEPADSGKFERLASLCEEISSRQEKLLVFTQFKEMTDPLASYLADLFGREGLVLHGGVGVKQRKARIDAFQREDGPPFFVLSLKAGGTGLNLTEASHVIHFDRWWNPAVENQATDRAFRIGQKRNVLVHKFVCRGTVEERIDALIEEKLSLADDLLEGGTAAMLTAMKDEELIGLVSLDIDRAKV